MYCKCIIYNNNAIIVNQLLHQLKASTIPGFIPLINIHATPNIDATNNHIFWIQFLFSDSASTFGDPQ